MRERSHLEDLGMCDRIILKSIFNKYDGGAKWIDLAQVRDTRRALVSAVMTHPDSTKCAEFLD